MCIRVILADDHAVVIDGIKCVVERKAKNSIEIVGVASNGLEVLELSKQNPADIYVIDISMPVLNGIETAERLLEIQPKSKIIILSMHDERSLVEKALKVGARGYLLKESATEEVIKAIHEVYKDRCYLSPKISKYLIEEFIHKQTGGTESEESETTAVHLTEREKKILQLIAEGSNSRQIAVELDIAFNTVLRHRNNLMRKLDIHSQAGLIRYALKEGLAEL